MKLQGSKSERRRKSNYEKLDFENVTKAYSEESAKIKKSASWR
jgi:hypothetical protein